MGKLSAPQIKALANAGSVSFAEMIDFRSNTITALISRGLIEKTIDGYRITSVGVARLRAEMPSAFIADCHLTLDDVLSETEDTDSTAFLPEHLTHGINGQMVTGHFKNSGREFNFRGVVKHEYLSAKIHGFRIPMVSVLTDDGRSIFVPFGNVKLDNWRPTFIQGTDDSDPVLEVLGSALIDGETVLWVNSSNGEFYLEANKPLTQRYWRAFPIQVVPTKWRAERNGLNLWRDEDMAMAEESTSVFPTRFGAIGALISKLTDDIQLCQKYNYDFSCEESILTEVIAHPDRNAWSVGNVQWSIRSW